MFRKLISGRAAAIICLGATSADYFGYDFSTPLKDSLSLYYQKQAFCAAQSQPSEKLPPK